MRLAAVIAASMVPAAALADGTMPQMDFHNPLTTSQVVWMVVIMVALYLALSRWGLPEMGAVLENRAALIARDLAAARAAKKEADAAVKALNATMKQARAAAQSEIAAAVAEAKTKALREAAAASARMQAQLADAEAQIEAARQAALAAIKPVAEEAAQTMLARLTGRTADPATVANEVDATISARQAA
jgi:F-type H+-transporting ATPase subunit b